jgi:hypothetical protein
VKNQSILYQIVNKLTEGTAAEAAFSFINMKKIFVFIITLFFLIASEYYLLTEIFTRKRLLIMAGSLAIVLLCIFVFLRFFRKSVTSA